MAALLVCPRILGVTNEDDCGDQTGALCPRGGDAHSDSNTTTQGSPSGPAGLGHSCFYSALGFQVQAPDCKVCFVTEVPASLRGPSFGGVSVTVAGTEDLSNQEPPEACSIRKA